MNADKSISLLVFDFDGVLTDNRVWVFEDGREAVACSRADGLAFDLLRKLEKPTLVLSTEKNPVVSARAKKLNVEVLQAIEDKGRVLSQYCEEHGFSLEEVMFVGNDLNDLSALRIVGHSVAVADAHPAVRKEARYILETSGGHGVAREVVENILELDWQ